MRFTAPLAAFALVFMLAACETETAEPMDESEETGTEMQADTSSMTIVDAAMGDERFSTLVSALQAAGLVETLQGDGPFTVFAPTNDAFNALPAGTLDTLLAEGNRDRLTSILTYHVSEGSMMADQVTGMDSISTLQGSMIQVSEQGGNVMLNNEATVVQPNVEADNGVIHAIDAVLMPPSGDNMNDSM